jgi:hypothetical protein
MRDVLPRNWPINSPFASSALRRWARRKSQYKLTIDETIGGLKRAWCGPA